MLPVIMIVLIVVISVAAIVALVQTFILGGNNTENGQVQESKEEMINKALISTDPSRGVRVTVRGELKADEKFRSYQITITPNSREMVTYAGYLESEIDRAVDRNNTKAYEEFVNALSRAGMMISKKSRDGTDNTKGLCYNGKILEFEILQNDNPTNKVWMTTCDKKDGTMRADGITIANMFLSQIPKGKELLSTINK